MKTLYMSQMGTVRPPDSLRTTLGSCIGIVLYDKKTKLFGLAHIMLPDSNGSNGNLGKYADTAVPELLKQMEVPEYRHSDVIAKIAGGANMFGKNSNTQSIQIGKQNIEAVRSILADYRIAIVSEDVGGEKGRQLVIDGSNESVLVNQIGDTPKAL
ncbi:MAG: chemotaxis protein CheD [Deltaproteobacteria bacterium]|nr:chemotaxis protein CheD [Deltaproteobacteria bacterium]